MIRISITLAFLALLDLSALGAQTNRPPDYQVGQPQVRPAASAPVTKSPAVNTAKVATPSAVTPTTAHGPTTADDKVIDAVMVKFESAVRSGDLTYAIEVMYTPVLNQIGKARAIAAAREAETQMKTQKITYLYWQPVKPYNYINGTVRRYAVIRFEAMFDVAGKKIKVRDCLLGIKVSPSTWQFIMGDDLSPAYNQQFLPDFPKNVTLPKPESIQL